MAIDIVAAPGDVSRIVGTRELFTALAASLDADVEQVEVALATLAELGLDEQTLDGFQSTQEDARRAAARCRATVVVLDARHRQMEDAVNATPDAARTDFYQEAAGPTDHRPGRPGSGGDDQPMSASTTHPEPQATDADRAEQAGPDQADRDPVRADRRAKADVILPLAELLRVAQNVAALRDDDDDDADPEELLDSLLGAVRKAAGEAGLHDAALVGTHELYDPQRHFVAGGPPAPGDTVEITSSGVAWDHGGEQIVLSEAFAYRYDSDRGAHIVTTPNGLDEEAEETEAIWLDDETAGDLQCYGGPGYYTVAAVTDCDGDADEDCPNRGSGPCPGRWVELHNGDADQAEVRHFAGDARIIMDCNE